MLDLPADVDEYEAVEYALAGSPDVPPPEAAGYAQVASWWRISTLDVDFDWGRTAANGNP